MKTVPAIIMGVLFWISIFFVVYANIKATEAEKQAVQAQLMLKLARKNEKKANEAEQIARESIAKAQIEISQLKRQLENCK